MLGSLTLEQPDDELRFASSELLRHRDEDVRSGQIAVVFRDLVFENEVIPPGVPGQLADESMILMEIMPIVREDDVRVDESLQVLEDVLDLATEVREEAVSKSMDDHVRPACRLQKDVPALPRLRLAHALRTQHDPRHLELRLCTCQRQQRGPTADLDVVRMRSDQEDPTELVREQRQSQH